MSEIDQIFKLVGAGIALVLGVMGVISVLVMMLSKVPIDQQINGLVNILIPTEIGIAQVLVGFGTAGAIAIIFIFWFFHNYVNN